MFTNSNEDVFEYKASLSSSCSCMSPYRKHPSFSLASPSAVIEPLSKMADQPLKTYRGNCHCAAFVYEVKVPEIKEAYTCNCSICFRKGYLLVVTKEANYEVVKGSEDQLTTYTFGEGKYVHKVGLPPKSRLSKVAKQHH